MLRSIDDPHLCCTSAGLKVSGNFAALSAKMIGT